jgi:hypothetical protein
VRVWLYVGLIVGAAVIGSKVGNALLPPGAELETAIYPVMGAIVGGVGGLVVAIVIGVALRSSDD